MKKMEYQSPSMHDSVVCLHDVFLHNLSPRRALYFFAMWRDGKYRYYLAIENAIFEAIVGTPCRPYGLPVIAIKHPKNSRGPLIPVTVSDDKGLRIWLDMTKGGDNLPRGCQIAIQHHMEGRSNESEHARRCSTSGRQIIRDRPMR